jgi:MFS family permease
MLESLVTLFSNSRTIIALVTLLITIVLSYYLARKYQLTKYQITLFILMMLFWTAIIIARDYRKNFAGGSLASGGLGLGESLAATVASAYGLISIFARLPFFALSDYFKSRKLFIGIALIFVALSSTAVVFNPSFITLYMSSLAFGLGASLLAMFNVIFAETFKPEKAMVSVSILSISPLIAESLVAPFQYFATQNQLRNYSYLWILSAILAVVALIFLFFVEDRKPKVRNFTLPKFIKVITDYKFLTIALISIVVSYIRFSTSGANMNKFGDILGMDSFLIAYLGVIFSSAQLIAGVLMGTVLTKKIGVKNTLLLGLILSLGFAVIGATITNPTILFLAYTLNGFGYGLTYNVLLGIALQSFSLDYREISMGIYQTFFALGIFLGDIIYNIVINFLGPTFSGLGLYQATYGVTSIVSLVSIVLVLVVFNNKNRSFLDSNLEN